MVEYIEEFMKLRLIYCQKSRIILIYVHGRKYLYKFIIVYNNICLW